MKQLIIMYISIGINGLDEVNTDGVKKQGSMRDKQATEFHRTPKLRGNFGSDLSSDQS